MRNFISAFMLILFAITASAQELSYEIYDGNAKGIDKEKLIAANSLKDLNPGFPSSWINYYESVELWVRINGELQSAKGVDDNLNVAQKNLLKKADMGSEIIVSVMYNPDTIINDEDDIREISFNYSIVPAKKAAYPLGYDKLKEFLWENGVEKIAALDQEVIRNSIIRFSIDKSGNVSNSSVEMSCGDPAIDEILLEAINKMPSWNPAENFQGQKILQNFQFIVGSILGC